LIGDFDCAAPKLHTIGVKAAENGLADILAVRGSARPPGNASGNFCHARHDADNTARKQL